MPRNFSGTLDYDDPNYIPVVPRKRDLAPTPAPMRHAATSNEAVDDGPELWPSTLEDLMGQSTRAYDVVVNYGRDCPAGTRWTAASIKRVQKVGKDLHTDVRILKSWKRQAAEFGTGDENMMRKMQEDVFRMHRLCKQVKDVIDEEERVPIYSIKAEDIDVDMRGSDEGYGTVEDGEVLGKSHRDAEADRSSRSPSSFRSARPPTCPRNQAHTPRPQ